MPALQKAQVIDFFAQSVRRAKLYRTCLFLGGDTPGSSSLANDIAALLLCNKPQEDGAACRTCNSCLKVYSGTHPDLYSVSSPERQAIPIDEIRQVIYEASIKPWEGRYKVFVICDIDFLREEGANALLKTLEEPPEHCVFLLTAQNENAVIDTILSRCQIFSVDNAVAQVTEHLMQEHNLPEIQAATIAALSGDNLERALQILEGWPERNEMLKLIIERRDPIQAAEQVNGTLGSGDRARRKSLEHMEFLVTFWHDIQICLHLPEENRTTFLRNRDLASEITNLAEICDCERLHRLLSFLFKGKKMLDMNVNKALLWENIFLRIHQTMVGR